MKNDKNAIVDYSKKIISAGKGFLKNPMSYMIGIPVLFLNALNKEMLVIFTETSKTTIISFSVMYCALMLVIYVMWLYNDINKVALQFEKEKGKMTKTHRKNILGKVDVVENDGNMVINVKIHLFGEYSKTQPIPIIKPKT